MAKSILSRFRPQVAEWFRDVFASPTPVQEGTWEAVSKGKNALVVAPTGSGKTLAAFLWALDSLTEQTGQQVLDTGTPVPVRGGKVKVLYISPLKALGVDVENNLRAPLTGIARTASRMGLDVPNITVAVRSGDTPSAERARQVRKPPDILITTPESAYLMLTSKAGATLSDVDVVIIDEIHAMAGTKRGVHLALTLERLEKLVGRPVQRVGLSATVRPLETVAGFLGGGRPVEIVAPPAEKKWDLTVTVPVEDMSDLPVQEPGSTIGELVMDDPLGITGESALPTQGSIWPHIEQQVYNQVMSAKSTIVFVNSRRSAERLTSRLNEIWAMEHDPESLSPQLRRDPAQIMSSADVAGKTPQVIARAHHGSVSKDERATTETMLKEGRLRAVISTSSLELGIDMGAVDLVIQVESPPSVASGLQRVGRAGHTVGATSIGSFYPKHRSDLVQTAVTVQRMKEGLIEEIHVPKNALDVLAQQTVAAVSIKDVQVDEWYETIRKAYPYRDLAREVFDSVIDLVSGVYPSTDFAELKPRVVYDRVSGVLEGRPGSQRVAVTSGGTIPDRGMFGVFLVGDGPRRVGELDEEMVYESRVGDVFTLGASSWRIEEITRDQVLVTPAPGHTGRLPFWTGDAAGRPAELGKALGAFRRTTLADPSSSGLEGWAHDNLIAFLQEQEESTGVLPDEKTLVLERFKDELGDWRIVLHTPYGRGVNAAWALAVGAKIAEETGMDAQAVAGDDGIVLRLPEGDEDPSAALFMFEAEEIETLVTEQVGNSALFASRFRECAARALLLPRRNPGKRAPLWQQRQRAAQLLDVARKYPSFPIILETVRECLQDVYDLPALKNLIEDLQLRKVRIAEVTTQQPSPFASALLFNYTGAFMYEGDSPLAEKRAAALALDPALLAKLLGEVELRQLLDPDIIAEVHQQLRRQGDRAARNNEELADSLRILGPIPLDELGEHITFENPDLEDRAMTVRINGREHLAQVLDAPLLRDALGVPVPPGVPAQVETITDALEQLVNRWVRTRGPFTANDLAEAFGLGIATAITALQSAPVIEGRYRQGVDVQEYCATEVLSIIRRRSLAAARKQTRPVSQSAFARFLLDWQQIAPVGASPELRGVDGTYTVIEQLAGVRLPASAWEDLVLPRRVADYSPIHLDELTSNGEVLIVGAGQAGSRDPWISLLPVDYAAQLVGEASTSMSPLQDAVLDQLRAGGAFLFSDILEENFGYTTAQLQEAMWGLVEAGLVSPDSFAPIRARLASGTTAHRAKRRPARSRLRTRTSFASDVPPDMRGRWTLSVQPADATSRSVAHGEGWLDRYGVLTRGSVVAEDIVGGFALAYKVLSGFEESGKAMRGYFIEGLGAAQFSTPAIIDRLRGHDDSPDVEGWPSGATDPDVYLIAAADPANPYGAALPWPEQGPSRAAGAMVVLCDGLLLAHLTRGGRTLTVFSDNIPKIATALITYERLTVEKINGDNVFDSPLLEQFRKHGATITPKGMRFRPPVARETPSDTLPTRPFRGGFGRR
ncbi:DEAD/DEAH box helicase [[Brevibacterium] flavum]|uniref:DEAD/DEAH box helicase n=1 Tax=[Brevibacterium] flavum TaxID=92706 RepID=A0A0F6Z4K5_9CORY|nr:MULTISPECIES: ATP-dependent helicase [Corynebacterium]AKF26877.1 DEAD/DEAH box helicase [[Brevibacterium] flavum]AST20115.1 ATP-dependent helicase [Corynebacterium glutamicum ATCC 14067]KEI22584.1 DEAD/DEAH box helicase [Corynebacterium glutamicum ATCC 14067]OKX95296.1 DEAD/DEAH box helicase [Corynebacterium glutamicum]QJS15264.1 ATP-dependent helicase [Corynebacterium glutamicum]